MSAAPGPVVEMEPYIVKGERVLPNPESWLYVKVSALELTRGDRIVVVPGYEILSPKGKKNTRAFVGELQLRQFAGAILFPDIVRALPRSAITLVWDDSHKLRANSGAGWRGDSAFTAKAFLEAGGIRNSRYSVGTSSLLLGNKFFQRPSNYDSHADRVTMEEDSTEMPDSTASDDAFKFNSLLTTKLAVSGGALTVYIDDSDTVSGEDRIAEAVWLQLNRYATAATFKDAPEWLAEGLSRLYASVVTTHGQIEFGRTAFGFPRLDPSFISSFDFHFPSAAAPNAHGPSLSANTRWQRDRPIVHIPRLRDVLRGEGRLASIRYGPQLAATFVHYGLYGDNGKFRSKFFQFIGRLENEPFSEDLFKKCFGKRISSFEIGLESYARTYSIFKYTRYKGFFPKLPEVTIREATQSDVARLKAEVLIAQGWVPNALDELRIAYWRGEREPRMLALLAFLEEHIGSIPRAQKLTAALLAQSEPPPRTHVVAAKLRLRELTADDGNTLAKAEADSVMEYIIKARERGVLNEDLCATLANLVLRSSEPPDADIVAFLAEAAKRYPLNQPISAAVSDGGASLLMTSRRH